MMKFINTLVFGIKTMGFIAMAFILGGMAGILVIGIPIEIVCYLFGIDYSTTDSANIITWVTMILGGCYMIGKTWNDPLADTINSFSKKKQSD